MWTQSAEDRDTKMETNEILIKKVRVTHLRAILLSVEFIFQMLYVTSASDSQNSIQSWVKVFFWKEKTGDLRLRL